ncbi:type ISP restriction/modification enzyme [Kurthia gibsonii]|uniref:type ISP restriction/modification enzyme n=1 Tax=Kurthia gibsonii TaxID=33946 RepID=UPI003F256D05
MLFLHSKLLSVQNFRNVGETPYRVKKMRYVKKGQLDTIIYNSDIKISEIPLKAYEYKVNGKSAIDWIMEQYQYIEDSKSGIVDDPNLYSGDDKYIFNLLLRIINLSIQTVDLINSLPPLEEIEE